MKITKYEHSCLDIEQDGKRFLIDPGSVTNSVPNFDNIIAVLVTHMHADHLDAQKLEAILQSNPSVTIYTVQAVADLLHDTIKTIVVTGGDNAVIGSFKLEFTGGKHALIHSNTPITDNVGVSVNDKFYYSGDSLSKPSRPVDLLAVPITAPWLKISEAIDFITELRPKQVFPVHDALLSEFGMNVNNTWLQRASEEVGATYTVLKTGQSINI